MNKNTKYAKTYMFHGKNAIFAKKVHPKEINADTGRTKNASKKLIRFFYRGRTCVCLCMIVYDHAQPMHVCV